MWHVYSTGTAAFLYVNSFLYMSNQKQFSKRVVSQMDNPQFLHTIFSCSAAKMKQKCFPSTVTSWVKLQIVFCKALPEALERILQTPGIVQNQKWCGGYWVAFPKPETKLFTIFPLHWLAIGVASSPWYFCVPAYFLLLFSTTQYYPIFCTNFPSAVH